MVKIKYVGESKEAKFRRIAGSRVNKILRLLAVLRNCSNTRVYDYSDAQVNKIFKAIEDELRVTKLSFKNHKKKQTGFKL